MIFRYANLGRGTAEQARKSWASLAHGDDRVDAVVVLEVDEGDKGYSDRKLMRRYFAGWRRRFAGTKAAILVNPKHRVWGAASHKAGRGVKRQSPARPVNELRIPAARGPHTTVVACHYPAGAKNGRRRPVVKAALLVEWHRVRRQHRKAIRRAHRRGDHVVTFFDANQRGYNWRGLHPQAVLLFAAPPDYGVAVPAAGQRVKRVLHVKVRTYLERLHQGHELRVWFTRRGH